jgi:hypothetical protein
LEEASSPYINRFLQPDTIIPDQTNPQSWNRYSYVTNRPVNANDPTGHMLDDDLQGDGSGCDEDCQEDIHQRNEEKKKKSRYWSISRPSGSNLEINILAGISIEAIGYDNEPVTVGLLYYSLGIVTDKDGEVQFYYSTKDQTYIPGSSGHMGGYVSGPAERAYPTDAFGLGITASGGYIFGDGFKTNKFLGKGYSSSLGVGPVSAGKFEPLDKSYKGYEFGPSIGVPFSMGTVATDTIGIGDPFKVDVQACRLVGLCGGMLAP